MGFSMTRNKYYNRKKLWVLFIGIVVCALVLSGRLTYLTIVKKDY